MFRNKKTDKIDYGQVNESVFLLNKILKLLFFVLIIVGIFVINYIVKEWKILIIFKTLLKILTPFFIGFIIAWLFNPLVKFLTNYKISRGLATVIVYVIFILFLVLFVMFTVPTLKEQINEFINIFPKFTDSFKDIINNVCEFFAPLLNDDVDELKYKLVDSVTNVMKDITVGLPDKVISIVSSFISGASTLFMGLFIGLYLLLDFDNASKGIIKILPSSWHEDTKNLMDISNKTLVKYIQGLLLTTSLIWIENSIGFTISGLNAGLLFAFFCGITNMIPYVGPYIGGIPAIIVGFSQNITVGIMTLISVLVSQLLDNFIFTPLVQSKNLKLHPVTIIISLLVFGHFFGIFGMVFAAPIIAIVKVFFQYFNEKYEFVKFNEESEKLEE